MSNTATLQCSVTTRVVPSSAACSNGISFSLHGVLTIRALPSGAICPCAPATRYPTQSIIRTFASTLFPKSTRTLCAGTNLGCVVIIVLPSALCGNSSKAHARKLSSVILGKTNCSINFVIKVDLPTRTGPTTPTYKSPFVRVAMS